MLHYVRITFMDKFWQIDSKYSRWYFNLIQSASKQTRSKKNGYFENHHIHPECLGGKRTKDNMVLLTAREHIIAHRLLIRMFIPHTKSWTSMVFAFKRMIDTGSKHSVERQLVINSRHIAERKRLHGLAMKIRMTGKSMPDHVKAIISAHNLGRKLTDEHKKSISSTLKKTLSSPEQREKISAERKSRVYKDEQRIKASNGMKTVWAERNYKKPILMKPGQNTPEERKFLWKLRISLAQIGKKVKPISDQGRKQRSDSMKAVWAKRRHEK